MEAFLIALVLMAALAFGTESQQVDPKTNPTGEAAVKKERTAARAPSVSTCDPGHHPIIQRDLTMPIHKQVNEDDR